MSQEQEIDVQPGKMTRTEIKASASLAGIFALRMLGLFLILPVFAVYAHKIPGGDDEFLVGLTLGIYGLTQGLLQIPFGIASDRWGRKPVIVVGLLIFAVGSFLAACADQIVLVMLGRALQGAGAISAAVTAMISDSVRERVITKAMAMVGASIGLTFALSLVIAPPLNELFGVPGLFVITGLLALSALPVILFVVPTPPAPAASDEKRLSRWQDVAFDPELLRLNFGIFSLHAVLTAIFVVMPGRLESMDLPVLHHWYVYLPAVLFGFALMVAPIRWAERTQNVTTLVRRAIILMTVTFGLFTYLMHSIWEIAFLLALFFTCFNVLEATLPGLISRFSPRENKGLALGIYNTTQNIGLFAGGAAGGWLAKHFCAETVFVAAALLMVLWYFVARGQTEPGRKKRADTAQ